MYYCGDIVLWTRHFGGEAFTRISTGYYRECAFAFEWSFYFDGGYFLTHASLESSSFETN
jgi:hypothetical protein